MFLEKKIEIQEMEWDNYENKDKSLWNGTSNLVYNPNRPTKEK